MNEKTSLEEAEEFMAELERVKNLPDDPKTPPAQEKEYFIHFEPHSGGGPNLVCTCGWKYKHHRPKVLRRAIQRHTLKTNHQFKEKD